MAFKLMEVAFGLTHDSTEAPASPASLLPGLSFAE
jgi:hypothetical protein